MKKCDIIIIGGGAAGLIAGCKAAENGKSVLIFDRLNKSGRKILVSGGGRCNMTCQLPLNELVNAYYEKKNFVRPALYCFDPVAIREYFQYLGLKTVKGEDNGVYPSTNKAIDVYTALNSFLIHNNVDFALNSPVDEILVKDGCVVGVRCCDAEYFADYVILAAGGKGKGELGADGSGFSLAEKLGHTIIPAIGGIVGVNANSKFFHGLAGIALDNCTVKVAQKKNEIYLGRVLFTHKGVSGPAILNASRVIQREVYYNKTCAVSICWKRDRAFWETIISNWRQNHGAGNIENMLKDFFPVRFISRLLDSCGIKNKTKLSELKKKDELRLLKNITEYKFTVDSLRKLEDAMVCSGGVDTGEIYSKSLESKIVKGLYFAGEIIDVDGRCGGFNLQWAFSSAALAVKSILSRNV